MGTFSRLRYVIAANVNALIEKAEDPEKLLRALIREMEDASEEARLASAELLAEQQRLERLDKRLTDDHASWQHRAEDAVAQNRDDLARAALQAKAEIAEQQKATAEEQERLRERVDQMEQDMVTLKSKLAEAKARLKQMQTGGEHRPTGPEVRTTPGERRMRRAFDRFDRLQSQVDSLEARVRSYEVGGSAASPWKPEAAAAADPAIEQELAEIKQRLERPRRAGAEAEATHTGEA
jgi:phage shock protein A